MPVEGRNGRITAISRAALRQLRPPTGIYGALIPNHPRQDLFANRLQMPQVDTVAAQALLTNVGDDGVESRKEPLALLG